MSDISCLRSEELQGAVLAGKATEAERLLLEEHLETCARCRETRRAFEALRRVRAWEPMLSEGAKERILQRLTTGVASQNVRRTVPATGRGNALALAACCVLVVAGLVVPAWRQAMVPEAKAALDPIAAANARDRIRPGPDGRVTLEGTALVLDLAAEAYFRRATRVVEIRRGSAIVEVSSAHQAPRIVLPTFAVRPGEATFRVDLQGVAVERGQVEVLTLDGQVMAHLTAGQQWSEFGTVRVLRGGSETTVSHPTKSSHVTRDKFLQPRSPKLAQ